MQNNKFRGRRPRPMSAGQRAFEARKAARAAKLHDEQDAAAIAMYNSRRHFTSAELKSMPVDKFLETYLRHRTSQAKFDVQMIMTELFRRARKCGLAKDSKSDSDALALLREKEIRIRRIPMDKLLEKCNNFVAKTGDLDVNVDTPSYNFVGDAMMPSQLELYRSWVEKMFIGRIKTYLETTPEKYISIKDFQTEEFIKEFKAMDAIDREKYAIGFCSKETIAYVAKFAKSKYGNGTDIVDSKTAYAYVDTLMKSCCF